MSWSKIHLHQVRISSDLNAQVGKCTHRKGVLHQTSSTSDSSNALLTILALAILIRHFFMCVSELIEFFFNSFEVFSLVRIRLWSISIHAYEFQFLFDTSRCTYSLFSRFLSFFHSFTDSCCGMFFSWLSLTCFAFPFAFLQKLSWNTFSPLSSLPTSYSLSLPQWFSVTYPH